MKNIVRIFMLPLQYPCGPQSSCCGPVGQSEEQISALKEAIEKIGYSVEVKNVTLASDIKEHSTILILTRTLGAMALPIIAIGNDVVSMGNPNPQDVVNAINSSQR